MKTFWRAAILATALTACWAQNSIATIGSSDCIVQAWVRAEDLAPDTISHGDLRVQVTPAHCANLVASVTLRLQLTEFAEVKHLRDSAVLPEILPAENQTRNNSLGPWPAEGEMLFDYSEYARAADPALWAVKAEERRAWSTEVVLLDNNPDFSQPRVTSFMVDSPAVNYPPAFHVSRNLDYYGYQPVKRHAFSTLGYHYQTYVNFTDGRSAYYLAGHTNFVPTSPKPTKQIQLAWNATFVQADDDIYGDEGPRPLWEQERLSKLEECLPKALRSDFVAEVTFEQGNVVQAGQLVKGRITVHATNGSTVMSSISAKFEMIQNHRWAAEQARASGDDRFREARSTDPWAWGSVAQVISVDPQAAIFKEEDNPGYCSSGHGMSFAQLTHNRPYFDFILRVPDKIVPTFSSYYSSMETVLSIELEAMYSVEAARCVEDPYWNQYSVFVDDMGEKNAAADHLSRTEEALWDSYTPVGKTRGTPRRWGPTLRLTASVPLVILGDTTTSQPAEHYLNDGVPSPVILPSDADPSSPLPVAQPVFIEESLAETSSRLMRPGPPSDPFHDDTEPVYNPARWYLTGDYAGLLWHKKVVALERGILRQEEGAAAGAESHSQHTFPVAL